METLIPFLLLIILLIGFHYITYSVYGKLLINEDKLINKILNKKPNLNLYCIGMISYYNDAYDEWITFSQHSMGYMCKWHLQDRSGRRILRWSKLSKKLTEDYFKLNSDINTSDDTDVLETKDNVSNELKTTFTKDDLENAFKAGQEYEIVDCRPNYNEWFSTYCGDQSF